MSSVNLHELEKCSQVDQEVGCYLSPTLVGRVKAEIYIKEGRPSALIAGNSLLICKMSGRLNIV